MTSRQKIRTKNRVSDSLPLLRLYPLIDKSTPFLGAYAARLFLLRNLTIAALRRSTG